MARLARGEYLDPQTIQIVHVTSRCVRRAFLCGFDPYSGKCYEHRRQWICERLEFLASVFAIDCLTFAVLSNHMHLILRSRPDIVRGWSDEQIARRWLRLCPVRKDQNGEPVEPSDSELSLILNNPRRIAELRIRLSDISWWMRMTTEKIAKQVDGFPNEARPGREHVTCFLAGSFFCYGPCTRATSNHDCRGTAEL